MKTKPYIIVIYGPTGVGKTDSALEIAQSISGAHIINGDVGQFYKPLTIGTAKPAWQHSSIPHHLFDSIDEPRNYTVCEYRQQVQRLIQELHRNGDTPIIVGGSGFYIASLLFPSQEFDHQAPEYDTCKEKPSWDMLRDIDPIRSSQIHPHDQYRIARAWHIWRTTGKKPSMYKPHYAPIAPTLMLHVTRTRKELYERIDRRVLAMMEQGWLPETQNLLGTPWELFMQEKRLIGYDDIINYLTQSTQISYDALIARIGQRTRNYAKRQETFWRALERSIVREALPVHDNAVVMHTIDLTLSPIDLYLKKLSALLTNPF
jgi:tRNA dimethylallyltransferase